MPPIRAPKLFPAPPLFLLSAPFYLLSLFFLEQPASRFSAGFSAKLVVARLKTGVACEVGFSSRAWCLNGYEIRWGGMNGLRWHVLYRATGLALSQTSKWCSSQVFGLALNTVLCFEHRVCMVAGLKRYAVVVFSCWSREHLTCFHGEWRWRTRRHQEHGVFEIQCSQMEIKQKS